MGQRKIQSAKKKPGPVVTSPEEFEKTLETLQDSESTFVLRLYVAGASRRSAKAIENIRRFCDSHLKGRYDLEVIDIYQRPDFAGAEQVIAAPTLVKMLPKPLRKLIGDMSDNERILIGLGLKLPQKTADLPPLKDGKDNKDEQDNKDDNAPKRKQTR